MEYKNKPGNIMTTKTQTKSQKAGNIFVSIDGNFIAIKIPDNNAPPDAPGFDVWKHDGSAFWEGIRYIERIDVPGEFAPRTAYQKRYTHPKKSVDGYVSRGATAFDLKLLDIKTDDEFVVRFNTSMRSLAPGFVKRRDKSVVNND